MARRIFRRRWPARPRPRRRRAPVAAGSGASDRQVFLVNRHGSFALLDRGPCPQDLLPASQSISDSGPGERHRHRHHGNAGDAEAERLETGENPAADGVAAAIDHGIDKILGLVLGLAPDHGEEQLARRAHHGVIAGAARDLERHQHRQNRRGAEADETDDGQQRHQRQRPRHTQPAQQPSGEQQLERDRERIHAEIDEREQARAFRRVGRCRRDDVRLLEVEKGRERREQPDEHTDAEQVRRARHQPQPGPDRAAERLFRRGRWRRVLLSRPAHQAPDAEHGAKQKQRGNRQQVDRTEWPDQQRGHERPGQGTGAAAGGNEAEQPARLGIAVEIHHETPEHRHHEQVEHAGPDKERARGQGLVPVDLKQQVEQQQVDREEAIDHRQQGAAREARGAPAEQRHRRQHDDKGAGEHPRQVLHAAGNAHLVTQRAQDVIAAQQQEKIRERPQQRTELRRLDRDQTLQPAHWRGHGCRRHCSSVSGAIGYASVACSGKRARSLSN